MSLGLDFPFILMAATLLAGFIALVDKLVWAHQRQPKAKRPFIIEQAYSFFPVLLLVLIIRSFVGQLYHVPTGSLEPTVMPGDLVLVTQFPYGLKLPLSHKKIASLSEPKTGQIALFRWPVNPRINFIKRVIGVPGDRISYINKKLYINDKEAKQTFLKYAVDHEGRYHWKVKIMEENLNGIKHKIYVCPKDAMLCPNRLPHNFHALIVPKGEYFMMGDNRDDSDDSRGWGFVPEKDLVGQGVFIVLNWKHPLAFNQWFKTI